MTTTDATIDLATIEALRLITYQPPAYIIGEVGDWQTPTEMFGPGGFDSVNLLQARIVLPDVQGWGWGADAIIRLDDNFTGMWGYYLALFTAAPEETVDE